MKLYKSLFIVAAVVAGMMTSCSEDGVWNQASQGDLGLTNGTSYAFNSTAINYTYYPVDVMEGMDVNVTITRGNTQGKVTLPVACTISDEELISGPESVTFEDGSSTATYPIHVKQEFEPGMSAIANLVIDTLSVGIPPVAKPEKLPENASEAEITKYLADSTNYAIYLTKLREFKLAATVTIQKDYNWKSLGIGTWIDDYMFGTSAEVEILQAVEDSKKYRVMLDMETILDKAGESADGNQSTSTTITLLDKDQDFRGVTIDGDNYVYWTPINTGWLNDGLDVIAYHPMDFSLNWARYNNTSYVSKFQSDGSPAIINLSGLMLLKGTSSGWAPCQSGYSIAQIVFPGVKVYNYSAKIEYAGLFTNPNNIVYALANYELSGADAKTAKTVKVAVISQDDDAEAVADAIAAGEFEAADLDDVLKDGQIRIEIPEGLTGKLQVILVIIDKNEEGTADEVKNVVAAKFEYFAGANPWNSLGTGYFIDDYVLSLFGYDPEAYECEIQESTENPGLYRLVKMYANVAADFGQSDGNADVEVNATNPAAVYILTQSIGFDVGYGDMSISTYGGDDIEYYTEKYGVTAEDVIKAYPEDFGTLEAGVITFPVFERNLNDGSTGYYQGYIYLGETGYYAGVNGAFKIVLPSAAASVKANAASRARATGFAKRLSGKTIVGKAVGNKSYKMFVRPKRVLK